MNSILNIRRLYLILGAVVLVLSIPFVAMQFTDEVVWTAFDFLIMGTLLLGCGLLMDQVFKWTSELKYRVLLIISILLIFILIWAELAVGIFGTPLGGS